MIVTDKAHEQLTAIASNVRDKQFGTRIAVAGEGGLDNAALRDEISEAALAEFAAKKGSVDGLSVTDIWVTGASDRHAAWIVQVSIGDERGRVGAIVLVPFAGESGVYFDTKSLSVCQ